MLNFTRAIFLVLICSCPLLAQATVELGRTRLVINEGDLRGQASVLRLRNPTQGPVLVQSWLEDFPAQSAPVAADSALFINPPLMRIEAGAQAFVRVVPRAVAELPRDRESIFYLNVHGIPQAEADEGKSQLVVSIVNQLKIFYRPKGLEGSPVGAVDGLQWVLGKTADGGRVLRAINDAPYSVSIATNVRLRNAAGLERIVPVNTNTIAPRSTLELPIPQDVAVVVGDESVLFGYLDDMGGFHEIQTRFVSPPSVR